ETGDHPSPYAMIPRPSKPVISREELASRTSYAGLAQHPETPPPEPPAVLADSPRENTAGFSKPVISPQELASRTPYAGLDPHAGLPPPEPPPPEPPPAASSPEPSKVANSKQIATAAPEPPPTASPAVSAFSGPVLFSQSTSPSA